MTGTWIALAALALAAGFGAYRARTDGRFGASRAARKRVEARAPAGPPPTWRVVAEALPAATPGERATLVQFSSAFCAPCRATRRVLGEVADLVPGVVHLEIDAEQHLDLVRALGIARTPTTLVLDADGTEVARAAGAPRKEQVLAALGRAAA